MKTKLSYIAISILLITNLVSIGYIERYCEVIQQQKNKLLLSEYLLKLNNEINGSIETLKKHIPIMLLKRI